VPQAISGRLATQQQINKKYIKRRKMGRAAIHPIFR
jgi:hypothetical protein